jgi:hypothetical protein
MFKNIFDYLGERFKTYSFVIGFFVFIWVTAWLLNGTVYTKFDLPALQNFFLGIIAKYGIDSWLNTNKGEAPK